MSCPSCGEKDCYVGLNTVECSNPRCKHYSRDEDTKYYIQRADGSWEEVDKEVWEQTNGAQIYPHYLVPNDITLLIVKYPLKYVIYRLVV